MASIFKLNLVEITSRQTTDFWMGLVLCVSPTSMNFLWGLVDARNRLNVMTLCDGHASSK